MGYYTDISNSSDAAKDVALANRLNGANGHTFLGTLLVNNVQDIFSIGEQLAGSGKKSNKDVYGTEPDTDSTSVQNDIDTRKAFNNALKAFNQKADESTAKALQDAYKECDSSSIKKHSKNARKITRIYFHKKFLTPSYILHKFSALIQGLFFVHVGGKCTGKKGIRCIKYFLCLPRYI